VTGSDDIEHRVTPLTPTVPITIALGGFVALWLSSVAVVGEVVLWFRSGFGLVVVLSTLLTIGCLVGCRLSGLRLRRNLVPGEGTVWAVLAVILWVQRVSSFGWPELTPHATSMDAAHHGAIAEWILQNQQIPTGPVSSLGRFAEYPNGSHIALAVWSWLTNISIWQSLGAMTLGLICLLIVVLGTGVAVFLESASPLHSHSARVASGSLVVFAVLAHRFTFGMAIIDFFFSQLMAFVVVVMGLIVGFLPPQNNRSRVLQISRLVTVVVLGAGNAVMYPLQIGVLPGAFLVAGALVWRNNSERRRHLLSLGIASGAATVAAVLITVPRLGEAADMRTAEGYIARVTIESVGGIGLAMLAITGLCMLTLRTARTPGFWLDGLAIGGLLCAGQFAAMLGAHQLGWFGLSNYSAVKASYWVVWIGIALAAVALGRLLHLVFGDRSEEGASIQRRNRNVHVTWVALSFLLTAVPAYRLATSRPTLSNTRIPMASLDAISFSREMAARYGAENIAIVGDELSPYAMLLVGTGSALTPGRFELSGRNIPWKDWPAASVPQDYLIVDGLGMDTLFRNRPGVALVSRRGRTVLLHRILPSDQQP
jgi:hypothetical protein